MTFTSLNLNQVQFGVLDGALRALLSNGRNVELAAAIIQGHMHNITVNHGNCPTLTRNGVTYRLRMKTAQGYFDLAPAKHKGMGRERDESEAEAFARQHNFLLIEYVPQQNILRWRFVENPRVVKIRDLTEVVA